MRNSKRKFELFSFYDRRGIERHLERMAEKGWMIEQIGTYSWKYRRIPPQKLHFCVTFHPDASEYEPEPSEEQKEFQEFCGHTGWILAVSRAQMLIFYNEQEDPVPIETEPQTEIDGIHKGMKKMYIRPYVILLAVALIGLGILFYWSWHHLEDAVTDPGILFLGFDLISLFVLCLVEMVGYYLWRYRAGKAAAQGEFLEPGGIATWLQRILLIVLLAGFAGYLVCMAADSAADMARVVLTFGAYLIGTGLINGLRNYLRGRQVSSSCNKILSLVASFAFYFVIFSGITAGTIWLSDSWITGSDRETYQYEGQTFTAYHDELPLTVSDLLGISDEGYSMRKVSRITPLAEKDVVYQYPRLDAENSDDMPGLDYRVSRFRIPSLYEVCRDQFIENTQNGEKGNETGYLDSYEPSDAAPWHAEEAYRHQWIEGYADEYVLFYGDRIIWIRFDWEPDEEQMKTVAEKLAEYN